jgi:hypothetical protein
MGSRGWYPEHMTDQLLWGIAGLCALSLLGMLIGIWYHSYDEDSKVELLQSVPTVPVATLPTQEVTVRGIKRLKAAEAEPEPLVESDFDPDGAPAKRKTRLLELIRDTQTKA